MAIYYRRVDNFIIISGKTYPYKDLMKSLGGRYSGQDRVWSIPASDETLNELRNLCKSVGGGPLKVKTPDFLKQAETKRTAAVKPSESLPTTDGMTISELVQKVNLEIQKAFPRSLWIYGEVQSLTIRKTAVYLQIADFKDSGSRSNTMTLNATIWSSALSAITKKIGSPLEDFLQEGIKLRLNAQVTLYKDRGSLSLNILDIDPNFTKGALALAREAVLKELRAAGLDQVNKALKPSLFPLRIGLISAPSSRAQSDFIHQLTSYGFPGTVFFVPAQMQGEQTIATVSAAIASLDEHGCDYIVVTRGGGSQADLRWFDDKKIALAIANAKTPLIAAIGHHDDVCIAEEIAYRREKTPTAAADFILSEVAKINEYISDKARAMGRQALSLQNYRSEQLLNLQNTLLRNATQNQRVKEERLDRLQSSLTQLSQKHLHDKLESINRLNFQLQNSAQTKIIGVLEKVSKYSFQLAKISSARLSSYSNRLIQVENDLNQVSYRSLDLKMNRLDRLQDQIRRESQRSLTENQHELSLLSKDFSQCWQAPFFAAERKIQSLQGSLKEKDPSPWLQQGWTQLYIDKKQISSISDVNKGDKLSSRLLDGVLELKVESKRGGEGND